MNKPLGEVRSNPNQTRPREPPEHQAPETTQDTTPAAREDAPEGPTTEQANNGYHATARAAQIYQSKKIGTALFVIPLERRNAVSLEVVSSGNEDMYVVITHQCSYHRYHVVVRGTRSTELSI